MRRKNNQDISISACLVELNGSAPAEIKLTPAGSFRAKDGRPHNLDSWIITDDIADKVIATSGKIKDQLLIDYEHQTLYSRENGQPSPAAGWFKTLEWRPGDGLYALGVEWTDTAKKAIESKEYRYISPVLSYNKKTGEVTSILMAALVNYPAIDGLNDLAAAHFNFNQEKENLMNKEFLSLLGMDDDADDKAVLSAVKNILEQSNKVDELNVEIAELKSKSPDLKKHVPVEVVTELQSELAALSSGIEEGKVAQLIASNLTKLPTKGLQDWAAGQSLEALSAYLENASEVSALAGMQSGGQAPDETNESGLTDDELAICAATGVDAEEFKKTKGDK